MNYDELRAYCLSLEGTTEGIKWDDHLCFMIAEKMFVITNIEPPHSLSLKINPDDFEEWTEQEGIAQAPHLAKRQWIKLDSPDVVNSKQLKQLIMQSRKLVLEKLPKKVQALFTL